MEDSQISEMELLKNQVSSLEQRLGALRANERLLIERQTLEKEAIESKMRAAEIARDIEALKEEQDKAQAVRDLSINTALTGLAQRLDKLLPEGRSYLEIVDGKLRLGWNLAGTKRVYKALSGGERISFDLAMADAFGANLIIKEASELDGSRLEETMKRFAESPCQVILVSCHDTRTRDSRWTRCEMPISKSA